MTVTTSTDHAVWAHPTLDSTPSEQALHVPPRTSAHSTPPAEGELAERMRQILVGAGRTAPDVRARARISAALYRTTQWAVFDDGDERAYVSRLWAEDWDCVEDAAYDEL